MKHKKLSARILSLVLTAAMVGTMMPTTVFATEGSVSLGLSNVTPPAQEQCSCDVLCTEDIMNLGCAVCAAEGADLTACEGEAPVEELAYDEVVELFAALPAASELTEENRDAIIAQVTAAMEAFKKLTAQEQALFMQEHADLYKAAMALNDAITGATPTPMAGVITAGLDVTAMETTDKLDTQGWKWDKDATTLTLNGITIDTTADFAIKLPADATIDVSGANNSLKIRSVGPQTKRTSVIEALGALTIKGTGTINIDNLFEVDDNNDVTMTLECMGINADGDVAIDGVTLNINVIHSPADVNTGTTGIFSYGNMTIGAVKPANVQITTSARNGYSLRAIKKITMNAGALTAKSGSLNFETGLAGFDFQGGVATLQGSLVYRYDSRKPINATSEAKIMGSTIKGSTGEDAVALTVADLNQDVVVYTYIKMSVSQTVSFDARNGETIADAEVGADGTITLPAKPTWGDYDFAGWYTDIDGAGTEFKNENLTASTTVYAKWTKGEKTVCTQPIDLTGTPAVTSGDGWTWSSNTLTLSGAVIDCSGNAVSDADVYGIQLPENATVKLEADTESTVKSGNTEGAIKNTRGIYAKGNLKTTGTGKLNAISGTAQYGSYGIESGGNIEFTSGTINATGGNAITAGNTYSGSGGISSSGEVSIKDGAIVNATGGKADNETESLSCGMEANTLTMTGGFLSAIAGESNDSHNGYYNQGVYVKTISLSGKAVLSAKGGRHAVGKWDATITATGATVTGAKEDFVSGTTKILTQKDQAIPVVISFDPTISVDAQSGTATYGTAASPTFAVTDSNFGGRYPAFAPTVEWVGSAPAGVTTSITDGVLTMNTTAATPAGEHKFKVVSAKNPSTDGNYESAEATLKVDKLEAAITWDTTTSFPYNGSAQAPTASVSNKVGSDAVTVTVAGGQTNVGSYTATADTLTGAAAGNYAMPSTKPSQAFTITAKTVSVTDGTLEVKKPFDSNMSAGTATGKLDLTGVVGSDDVSVKIDTIGTYADSNVGKNKTVTLTISLDGSAKGNYALSSTSYSFTKAEITKVAYNGTPATAPDSTPENKGDKSITVKPVTPPDGESVEYAVSKTNTPPTSDSDWQDSTTFDKLDPNTEYFFFARVKENDNHAPGGESAGTSITTDRSVYTGTQATAPTATKTHNTVTLNPQTIGDETVEYGIENADGTIAWQDSPTFSGLNPNTAYKFFARVKENDTHKAGTTSAGTAIKTTPAPTTVSGNVKDGAGSNLSGAIVTLVPSDPEIKATTDADGNYTLSDVPAGTYSIVVKNGDTTITDKIDVAGTPISGKNMQFLSGDKNTVVESKPGTPDVAVGGMNDLLNTSNIGTTLTAEEKVTVDASGSVELRFTADLKAATDVAGDKSKIEAIAGSQKIDLLLDLSVRKTVKDSSGNVVTNGAKITTLAGIIEVVVQIPAELQGKAGLALYRVHNGTAQALSTSPDANGEYYTISGDGESMTLYVKNFSIYALGYNAFTVTLSDGGTGASGNGNYSSGETVTINAGTKSGYTFNGWTVAPNTVVLANPSNASTTFTMPGENVTVTANWTGGGSTGGGGGGTTTYPNTVNQPENGTVSIAPKSPSKGQTVTITTKPDAGYVVDTVLVKDANGKTIAVTEKGVNSYTFVQPGSKVTVEVTYTKAQTSGEKTFTDVTTNDWFYNAVMAATANGWFSGTSATTFSPNSSTTRGMIATILHRMENTPGSAAASFADVASDAYYAGGVAWAQEHGIVTGYGNGNYGPNNNITREQLAAILYRYAAYKGYDMSKTAALGSFADANSVSGYATDAMSWAVGSGLISGRGNNTLAPTATATRAEVAVILVRFEELFAK